MEDEEIKTLDALLKAAGAHYYVWLTVGLATTRRIVRKTRDGRSQNVLDTTDFDLLAALYLEQVTIEEAARTLHISPLTVMDRYMAAMERLVPITDMLEELFRTPIPLCPDVLVRFLGPEGYPDWATAAGKRGCVD